MNRIAAIILGSIVTLYLVQTVYSSDCSSECSVCPDEQSFENCCMDPAGLADCLDLDSSMTKRRAFIGKRRAFIGKRRAFIGKRRAFIGKRRAFIGKRRAFIGKRSDE